MKVVLALPSDRVLGHPEFMRGGSVLTAQSTIALPIGFVFGQPRSELLVFKLSRSRNGVWIDARDALE